MVDKNRRAALAIVLAAAGCVAMAWVEGVLRPVYPVKSALKIAVFLGCAGLYALFSRDFAPFRIFRRPRQIKLAALPAALSLDFCRSFWYNFLSSNGHFERQSPLLGLPCASFRQPAQGVFFSLSSMVFWLLLVHQILEQVPDNGLSLHPSP